MTKALYFTKMNQTECNAHILQIQKHEDKHEIILNQTIFHPQGGGQPTDTGIIKWHNGSMHVEHVSWQNNQIIHSGIVTGEQPKIDTPASCTVNRFKRKLHSRIHSAGHLIAMALETIAPELKATKGYHFPNGPYIEFKGTCPENKANFITQTETQLQSLIDLHLQTTITLESPEAGGKTNRKVAFGSYKVPCGGTHVQNLKEIGSIKITKIKNKKNIIKVSYSVTS